MRDPGSGNTPEDVSGICQRLYNPSFPCAGAGMPTGSFTLIERSEAGRHEKTYQEFKEGKHYIYRFSAKQRHTNMVYMKEKFYRRESNLS